jgi:hypothetical protein
MSRRAALAFIALLSLIVAGGCSQKGASPEPEEADPAPKTIVVVENNYAANVNVYLASGETRALLGNIGTMRRRTFQVPDYVLVGAFVDVNVVAEAVGEGTFVSRMVRLTPGDEIKVFLTDHLQRSWITIRPQ